MSEEIKEEMEGIKALLQHDDLDFVKQGLLLWDSLADSYEVFQASFEAITSETLNEAHMNTSSLLYIFSKLIPKSRGQIYTSYWCLGKLAEFSELDEHFQTVLSLHFPAPRINRHRYLLLKKYGKSFSSMNPYEFPDNLGNLQYVQEIIYTDGIAEAFPDWLREFPNLKMLNLENNFITELPDWLSELRELRVLNLKNNHLTKLDDSIRELTELETLNLSANKIQRLPEAIGECTKLKSLLLSGASLHKLPDSFGQLQNLEELNLRENQIRDFPSGLGLLSNLQILNLGRNQIQDLPYILDLPNLEELDLSENLLYDLPDDFWNLTSLRKLNLYNNQISYISKQLMNLQNLQWLNLIHNKIVYLPDNLFDLPFAVLKLDTDKKEIEQFFGKTVPFSKKVSGFVKTGNSVIACFFTNNRLKEIPSSMMRYRDIKELRLNFPLEKLPEGIGELRDLTHLNLSGCRLEEFPKEILGLKKLRVLDLRGSKLCSIPEEIGELTDLRVLNLIDNKLEKLPAAIQKLSRLKQLHLQANALFWRDIAHIQKALPKTVITYHGQ